ncbi:MAG: ABC transporter ATP-binding protein [Candidatus Odinarchaeia archaeon]
MMREVIVTENLTKIFNGVIAVGNINLKVFSGETFGLIGPNGAGKTTTIRLLNGIIKPTSGSAFINGFNVVKDSIMVKTITGLLPETPGLYEKLTAKEFLEFIGELYSVPRETLKERIDELLELFEIKGRENDLLEGYSRGMKQKVLLASTLIHDPIILFLDEPTSNLDPNASRMVKDMISQLSKKAGKTIFICSHILSDVEKLCNRLAIINKGKIIEVGKPAELIKKTDSSTLEEAYLKLVGSELEEKDLLSWRV